MYKELLSVLGVVLGLLAIGLGAPLYYFAGKIANNKPVKSVLVALCGMLLMLGFFIGLNLYGMATFAPLGEATRPYSVVATYIIAIAWFYSLAVFVFWHYRPNLFENYLKLFA